MPETPNEKLRPTPAPSEIRPSDEPAPPYAELDAITNFSFLRGASHADEIVYRTTELGYRAIAITDVNTMAGVVRAYDATNQVREQGGVPLKLIVGCRLALKDAPDVLVWVPGRPAYARLCRLLTLGKRCTEKGECELYLQDLLEHCDGILAAVVPSPPTCATAVPAVSSNSKHGQDGRGTRSAARDNSHDHFAIRALKSALGNRLSLAASRLYGTDDESEFNRLRELSKRYAIPLLATNHVHYHDPSRRVLQDVLTCVRHGCTIHDAGYRLLPNAERYLKSPAQMHRLFADCPRAIARGLEIAEQCAFSLDELQYEYPDEIVPPGMTATQYLADLAWNGARDRYPDGIPEKVARLLRHELELIGQLKFEPYFLTVYDIVRFARSRGILCQGRGSAANSVVCYCLAITSVNPAEIDVLFERFISAARNEPPDIDVDFEHERREEVIQYVYEKYGRDRAGMCAEVITYRGRSAVRDVGKALGLSLDMVDSLANRLDWWHRGKLTEAQLRESGLDPSDPTVRRVVEITGDLMGFPRHLSQHVGGMVMTRGPLSELVPIENASMPDRTVIEWDKDDIDTLRMLKVDVLALGMLTCISKAFRLINEYSTTENTEDTEEKNRHPECSEGPRGALPRTSPSSTSPVILSAAKDPEVPAPAETINAPRDASHAQHDNACVSMSPVAEQRPRRLELHTVPPEDPVVYHMLWDADTIGVFQIESRAQMSMLPRLKPKDFYDLVIEVAIVRPGPIQGNMVHPYLRRRNGEEPVTYPSPALEGVLKRTLGVPLFQEQAMKLAMVGAGFTAAEADQLRRAMAAWKKNGALEKFHPRIINGMLANGYTREFAEQCFLQIKGFGEYGFPESHAASFALLVYVSAWIKRHHPAAFACALLNSQPMGFYAPAQIVRDAANHGVTVLPIDVNASEWDCTLEERDEGGRACPELVEGMKDEQEAPAASGSPFIPHPSSCCAKREWGKNGPRLRLGLRLVKGLRLAHAVALDETRKSVGRFKSVDHLHRTTFLPRATLQRLAEADTFGSMGLSRREGLWRVLELSDEEMPLFEPKDEGGRMKDEPNASAASDSSFILHPSSFLPTMPLGQEVMTDYSTTSLSLKAHPCSVVRNDLAKLKILKASDINALPAGRFVRCAGLVLIRQRPGTASGIVFETIEDETGIVNLIVRPNIYDRYRPAARHAGLLQADGYVERQGQVVHVMVKRMFDLSYLLNGLSYSSRDFH